MEVILKSKSEIEAMRRAGALSAAVLREVGARCLPGVTTLQLDEFAESYIRSRGGTPTFKGYGGFPGTICASINEEVVHGIPSASKTLKPGDVISIDTGATVDGWAGDNAWTFAVGAVSSDKRRLLETAEKCLWAGISAARPGNRLGDIGHAVQTVAKRAGLGVVRDYTGHGIGRDMHEPPNVPNYGFKHTGMKLQVGMVIAIEPMITLGTHKTRIEPDGWLVTTQDGKPAAHFEKTVAITEDGPMLVSVEADRDRPL